MAYEQYKGGVGTGAILWALREYYKVPLMLVEEVCAVYLGSGEYDLHYNEERVGVCRMFPMDDGTHRAVCRFTGDWHGKYEHAAYTTGELQARVILTVHNTMGVEIYGEAATPLVHETFRRSLTNYMNDPFYELHKKAGAFFQGGSHDPKGKWFLLEFWNPEGVEAFVQKLNSVLRWKADETLIDIEDVNYGLHD